MNRNKFGGSVGVIALTETSYATAVALSEMEFLKDDLTEAAVASMSPSRSDEATDAALDILSNMSNQVIRITAGLVMILDSNMLELIQDACRGSLRSMREAGEGDSELAERYLTMDSLLSNWKAFVDGTKAPLIRMGEALAKESGDA